VRAIAYGIVHDLVSAHICVEYFTIGHPRVIESESPIALAMVWGVLATWWVGLLLGLPLGIASQVGHWPEVPPRVVGVKVLLLLGVMALCAAIAGATGWYLAAGGIIHIEPWQLADRVPENRHVAFLGVGAAHLASYAVGFLGGTILIVSTLISRCKRQAA
jgi:hypothetical protein